MNEKLFINNVSFKSDLLELSDYSIVGKSNIETLLKNNNYSRIFINAENIENSETKAVDWNDISFIPENTDIIVVCSLNGWNGKRYAGWMQLYLNEKTMESEISEIEQDTILNQAEYDKICCNAIDEYIDNGNFEEDLRFSKGFTRKLNSLIDFYQNKDLEELPESKRSEWILAFRNAIFDTVSECSEWYEDCEGEMQIFNIDADFCDVFHKNLLNGIQSILKN